LVPGDFCHRLANGGKRFNRDVRDVTLPGNHQKLSAVPTRAISENERVADKLQKPVTVRVERPRARRYPFVASVELTDLHLEVQFQERSTDLSLYGCRVMADKPFPAGTRVRIKITRTGDTFSALGRVAYATSDGDMGIVFTRIEPNHQQLLEKWISELRDR